MPLECVKRKPKGIKPHDRPRKRWIDVFEEDIRMLRENRW